MFDITPFEHTVEEFPKECVKKLINLIRNEGLAGLKANKLESIMCLCMIVAWAVGRIKDGQDKEDDGVIFGASPHAEVDCGIAGDLCDVMAVSGDLRIPASSGLVQGVIARQLLALAMSYLFSLLKDMDKVEDLAQQVLDWISEQFK